MLKKKTATNFRAALKLIATEDMKALRILRRTITNRTSRSFSLPKKS